MPLHALIRSARVAGYFTCFRTCSFTPSLSDQPAFAGPSFLGLVASSAPAKTGVVHSAAESTNAEKTRFISYLRCDSSPLGRDRRISSADLAQQTNPNGVNGARSRRPP